MDWPELDWLMLGGSLAAVLATAGLVAWLGLGRDARIEADAAARLAEDLLPGFAAREAFVDKAGRSVNRDALNDAINERLAHEDRAYWIERFNKDGVACGHINDMSEVFAEPQIAHLGLVQDVVSNRLGPQRHVGQPVTLTRTPSVLARAAPRRGEHTEEVLGELGLAAGDIAQMKSRGVF